MGLEGFQELSGDFRNVNQAMTHTVLEMDDEDGASSGNEGSERLLPWEESRDTSGLERYRNPVPLRY
jgi:hypothetical protein